MKTFVVKVTSICNLKCPYCYYMGSTPYSRMDVDVLERVIQETLGLDEQYINYVWHGGEPLSAGLEFYENVVKFQKQFKKDNQTVTNSLQTNGTLLSTKWAIFFKEHDFSVGVSLDGPEYIHNINRVYASQNGSFQDTMCGIENLKAYESNVGILAVVTKDSLPHADDIYHFFTSVGLKSVDFLPHSEIDNNTGKFLYNSITPDEFFVFMRKIFDIWFLENDPTIHVRTFENMLTSMLGGRPTICKFAGTCSEFLMIQPNGDVFPDDNYVKFSELRFGNLLQEPLAHILLSAKRQAFVMNVSSQKTECKSCQWYPHCHGGCSYRRYMANQNFNDTEYFCPTWKALFPYINEKIAPILKMSAKELNN